jgi:ABC-type nitrate/sulfonate/bicarbonate transport system permease component
MKRRDLLLAVLAILVIWQLVAWIVNLPILPTPIDVAGVFVDELKSGLMEHFLISLWRVLASTLLAIVIAAPIGLILGQSKRLNNIFSPLIYLVYPIPKVVFVPIVLLFLGLGDFPKIVIIFLILFFQILVLVRDAAAGLRPELIQSVRSLGAAGSFSICLPASQFTGDLDRPAAICWHGGSRTLHC